MSNQTIHEAMEQAREAIKNGSAPTPLTPEQMQEKEKVILPFTAAEVTKGIDANKVLETKVNLDSDRWKLNNESSSVLPASVEVTPDLFIYTQNKITDVEKEQKNRRGSVAMALFAYAAECVDIYEFEAFCLTLKAKAGWDKWPEQFRNYKSRITTHWKNSNMPSPDAEVLLPKLDAEGKPVDEGKTLVKREPVSLHEYYGYCKGLADKKTDSAKQEPVPSKVESTAGVTIEGGQTIVEQPDGTKEKEQEVDTFTRILGELQTIYAQADPAEKQRMVRRVAKLREDMRKAQEARFNSEGGEAAKAS